MSIGWGEYLGLATILFSVGALGFLVRRNVLVQLMSIEIMLNAVNLVFVACNRWLPENQSGQVFAIMVIAVAAAEVAVGLAILISLFRLNQTVDSDSVRSLRH